MSQSMSDSARTGDVTDERTRKAREEPIHVTDARENNDSYTLAVENGDSAYDVQVSKAAPVATGCSCPDETFRSPEGGCKHRRKVTSLLNIVETLADDEYVGDAEMEAMLDAPAREVRVARRVVSDE